MGKHTADELEEALQILSSTINRCEKAQLKFAVGSSQHTLLENRLKALYISKSLITDDNTTDKYSKEELTQALRPVLSIISKCEKAQPKFAVGSANHTRFKNLIKAMDISRALISDELAIQTNTD